MSQYLMLLLTDQLNNYNWEIDLYNDLVLFIELLILFLILSMIYVCSFSIWQQKFNHWESLEIIWTILPAFILIFLGFPTIKMLYLMESFNFNSFLSVKISGHQWYWEYSYPELNFKFDSYPLMISKIFRMLETSSTLVMPISCNIRMIVTSSDVLHSWAVPTLGLKMDACPGRLNFFLLNMNKPGIYVGQCSELCGSFHHLMPIYMETTSISMFLNWIKTKY